MSTLHSATRDIISSQPTAQEGMSARSQFANNVNANGDGSIGSAKSGDPSRTAADTAQDQV
uniref:SMP domain-containing protein n=1 Tax=Kwoniella dejecticola CBS 10117 TaxID=1296121 RepID=A0A1A6AA96_9TREE|nr:uncharacterized protein I303_03002 [Kwoniella dejecticola CBS 10117]OBR86980.1 hypothetical protein I303_03002 [Kwoniella dejecticola CBS 10117]